MKKKRKTLSNSIDGLSLVQLELEIWLVAVFDNSPRHVMHHHLHLFSVHYHSVIWIQKWDLK